MSKKIDIDYSKIENVVNKKVYKLAEVKDQIVKIAFDVVRFKDGDKAADLWKIEADGDGDYIVRLYQENVEKIASNWDVHINKVAGDLQISYKGEPLTSISAVKLGMKKEDLDKVQSYLPKKLSENKQLVQALLKDLDKTTKDQILNRYPELI